MDLLCEPRSTATPPPQTPYVCEEQWDGGMFITYPVRKGKIRWVPPRLRQLLGVDAPDEPYLETLYPTPSKEIGPFLQTWLFFGLLAESLSLNEVSPGVRLVEQTEALEEIRLLHEKCLVKDENGERHLTGLPVLEMGPLIRERTALDSNLTQRLIHVRNCLQFANLMLLSVQELDEPIRYSLCALGEMFTTGLFTAASTANPRIEAPMVGFSWHNNYIKPGGAVETQMLERGWCPSEIDKIRAQFQGLHTMHYIGQLKKSESNRSHENCSNHLCVAFQMDVTTYRPAHAVSECDCSHISIDRDEVHSILRYAGTYPVIRVEGTSGSLDDLKLFVEPYEPGLPYVALSHVWANGMGNPTTNSLPKCQIQRVARLIASLQDETEPQREENAPSFRVWVDTLCCPVALEGKMIALQRIADVYKNATHVLVLDATLTEFKSNEHQAELLLRIFGASPWTRRLWTLQEGALTKSLYVQFADKALNTYALLTQLFVLGRQDIRHMRIWQDVMNSFNELQGFFAKEKGFVFQTQPPLINLQRALHFRSVSVPSDEALCISTLLSLDTKYIAEAPDVDTRMARVWELVARSEGGLSPRLLFYADESLSVPGWRWAPRSLLGSFVKDSVMGIDERVMRFAATPEEMGVPTSLGLKVELAGCRVLPLPRDASLPLHPWPDMIKATEDQIIVRNEKTGQWLRVIDWYRSKKVAGWTNEERFAYDQKMGNPLCKEIDTGNCALIFDQEVGFEGLRAGCMVQVELVDPRDINDPSIDPAELTTGLKTRRTRNVIISALNEAEAKMMESVQELANKVALDSRTRDFLAIKDRDSDLWKNQKIKVRDLMKEVMADAWKSQPELAQTVKNYIGTDLEEYMWVMIPKIFSHDVVLRDLPETQLWFVD
ncbi:hypothetical protein PT974_07900 [Cladobotryum mycophilum]|uniref:Heterokaryon incompatibility domain-containing protein n=1 Tax=Cladobotryum mycophilum TaxID=491253 RepID=A0ABR0SCZ1_9HYPO